MINNISPGIISAMRASEKETRAITAQALANPLNPADQNAFSFGLMRELRVGEAGMRLISEEGQQKKKIMDAF